MAEILNSTINRGCLKTKNREFDLSFDTFYIENSEFIDQLSIVGEIKNLDPSKPGVSFIFNSSQDKEYQKLLNSWPKSEEGIFEIESLKSHLQTLDSLWFSENIGTRELLITHISFLLKLLKLRFPDNFKAVETEMTAKSPEEKLSNEELFMRYRSATVERIIRERENSELQMALETSNAREIELQIALEASNAREIDLRRELEAREANHRRDLEAREVEFQNALEARDVLLRDLEAREVEFQNALEAR